MTDADDLVVLASGTIVEMEVQKTSLDAAGIPSFLKDEIVGTIAPWSAAAGGAGAVKILVKQSDLEEARALLAAAASDEGG